MTNRTKMLGCALIASLTLLAGCMNSTPPTPSPTPTSSATPTPTPSASPTPTLSPEQQVAANAVLKFYEVADQIATNTEVDLNSLYEVSGGELVQEYLKDLQMMRVTSRAANTDGRVLSRSGSTTRKRDQATHATNRAVFTPIDQRAVAVVVLEPHPRFSDPRAVHPAVPNPVGGLRVSDSAAGGAFRTGVAQPDQLGVDPVGADLALAAVDPFLDLVRIGIDQLRPLRGRPRWCTRPLAGLHIAFHRVVGTTRQLSGVP